MRATSSYLILLCFTAIAQSLALPQQSPPSEDPTDTASSTDQTSPSTPPPAEETAKYKTYPGPSVAKLGTDHPGIGSAGIAGIAVGGFVLIVLIFALIWHQTKKRKTKKGSMKLMVPAEEIQTSESRPETERGMEMGRMQERSRTPMIPAPMVDPSRFRTPPPAYEQIVGVGQSDTASPPGEREGLISGDQRPRRVDTV
jgi:hypothetical protein